jgi:hypothetical protein
MWSRDHEIAVVVRSVATLDEVRDAAVGGPEGAARDAAEFCPVLLWQATAMRASVDHKESAEVFQRLSRLCLAEPTAKVDFTQRQVSSRELAADAHGENPLLIEVGNLRRQARLVFVIYRGASETVGRVRDVDSETVRRGTLAKPRGVLVYGRAVNSGRSRALGYVVGKQDFAAIAKDRGQTLDESADIDLDRGGFVDGNCLDGKAVEKRTLVAVLVEDGSIERDCLPFLLEAEGWARQGSYPVKNNAIGECPEGRSMWIKGFLPMQKVEDEILLILDLHPWYGPALREAAGIETDIAQDAAVDAAIAIAGLHGFRQWSE